MGEVVGRCSGAAMEPDNIWELPKAGERMDATKELESSALVSFYSHRFTRLQGFGVDSVTCLWLE